MSAQNPRAFVRSQILEMEHLLKWAGDHPIMGQALKDRRDEWEQRLADMPPSLVPRTVLFFTGAPVLGSEGIDAQFAISVLQPFLEMVKTEYAASKHGEVGSRGPRRDEAESRLLLTGLPRGSFGLELSKPDAGDFYVNQQLSQSLVHVTEIIKAAGESDDSLAVTLEKATPRLLGRLKDFLQIIHGANAGVRVVSGDLECSLDTPRVEQALYRVSGTTTTEREEDISGYFRGATLDSWRFDFKPSNAVGITGRIAESVSEADVTAMVQLTNRPCVARLREVKVTTRSGLSRITYELISLAPVELTRAEQKPLPPSAF